MKWIEKNKYHVTSGPFTVAIYFLPEKLRYGLSKNQVNLGYFDSMEAAKSKAKDYEA